MKWAEDQEITSASRRPMPDLRKLVETLAEHPGRWAELDYYPIARIQSARSRGSQIVRRYPILEYGVHRDDVVGIATLHIRVRPNP